MNDDILVLQVKQGDRKAFDELYQKYKRPILNYIYRFIGNSHSAEELTQETFVRVYMNIQNYQPRAKFSSWVYRIAGNLAKNFLRHASYDKRASNIKKDPDASHSETISPVEYIADSSKKPDENAQSKEEELLVQQAIGMLPDKLKEAVILCDIKGFSYAEAADIMKCSPMTAGSRIWRGRERLTKLLEHMRNGERKK
jgi:RNA polymerase sigma-70 factor, ECF subfamily